MSSQEEKLAQLLYTQRWTREDAAAITGVFALVRKNKTALLPLLASNIGLSVIEMQLRLELRNHAVEEWWKGRNVEGIPIGGKVVEVNGWLASYVHYVIEQEAPPIFHLWIGIFCVGAALGRNVFLSRGYYELYPNQFIVLVAPSGSCRRTTATGIGISLLRDIGLNVLAERITPEKLPYDLKTEGECAEGVMYASELSFFLDKKEYNRGLVKLLTDFYDCPSSREVSTKKDKKVRIENVCVNLLGTCPPDEFGDALPTEVTTGGFMARCIILLITDKARRIFQGVPDTHTRNALIQDLALIRQLHGEVKYDDFALPWMERWYKELEHPTDIIAGSGYYERKHDHLLKLAMVVNASSSRSLVLTLHDLLTARDILDAVEPLLRSAHEIMTVRQTAKDQEFILNLFKARKAVLHSELVRVCRLRMGQREFKDAVMTLVESKQIERVRSGKEDYWRRVK